MKCTSEYGKFSMKMMLYFSRNINFVRLSNE